MSFLHYFFSIGAYSLGISGIAYILGSWLYGHYQQEADMVNRPLLKVLLLLALMALVAWHRNLNLGG